ncbi:YmfQ family protein [Paenibacillus pasadenensis]|uniref:putative phage tail protein n=1 Tax=Paenibacillus pasadenensis TaxID=217090 RepID=UPI00203BD93D|nr:putative phage tail protein [Paenibacillus pasadenensis]MCM3748024.1 YmfQ family protein [Paenibacillus pasadenensis]
MAEPLLTRLPEFYEDSREFKELLASEDAEVAAAESAVQSLLDDQFVMTAGEEAIRRRERVLGILADEAAEPLTFRRMRIVNRYSTKPPFTLRYLQKRLDELAGPGRALAMVDPDNYVLTVSAAIQDALLFREVERTIQAVKPANLIYEQQTAVADTLQLHESIRYLPLTRETRLGSWSLGVHAFTTEGDEVMVK